LYAEVVDKWRQSAAVKPQSDSNQLDHLCTSWQIQKCLLKIKLFKFKM